jgi:hypothetical protein
MARLVCSYQLRQRTDAADNLVVRSDNTAVGLIVLLFGLLWAGLWIVLLREDPNWREMYSLRREPSHFSAEELNRLADDIERTAKDSGIDMKPLLRPPPVSRRDPGGFAWGRFGLLVFTHGIPLIAIVTGLSLMFAFRTRRFVYPLSKVALVLHPKVIPGKAWDWTGFALTLVAGSERKLELARNKKREPLMAFAAPLQERGIELREVGAGESTDGTF